MKLRLPSPQPSRQESSAQEQSSPARLTLDGSLLSASPTDTSASTPSPSLRLEPIRTPAHRVLDFDIETRLVGFYSAGRFRPAGCEPIAIGCSWYGEDTVRSILLGESTRIPEMLEWFREFYDEATMVTGHYITKFDLPILNGACLEWGLAPLGPKLCQDTKTDLIDFEGMSKSQENLSQTLRVDAPKYHMSDADWRRATRLTPGGQKRERKRVESDVRQHKLMRERMLERGMLAPPKIWEP
jgi:hypothetical protein